MDFELQLCEPKSESVCLCKVGGAKLDFRLLASASLVWAKKEKQKEEDKLLK